MQKDKIIPSVNISLEEYERLLEIELAYKRTDDYKLSEIYKAVTSVLLIQDNRYSIEKELDAICKHYRCTIVSGKINAFEDRFYIDIKLNKTKKENRFNFN